MSPLDSLIQACLGYQAAEMSDPHAYYDADLELNEEMIIESAEQFLEEVRKAREADS